MPTMFVLICIYLGLIALILSFFRGADNGDRSA